jgi:hypothetical protein
MSTFVIIGVVLVVAVTYYLSRHSNQKAAQRLGSGAPPNRRRTTSPAQLARFEQQRAEHLSRAQAAQTDNQIGGSFG